MPPSASQSAPVDTGSSRRPSGFFGAFHAVVSFLLEEGINVWVHLTGRRIRNGDEPWLAAPLGEKGRIGTSIYERIASAENLQTRMPPTAGLIPDFESLRGPSFDPIAVRTEIRHFYEHAAMYHLDVWSEVSLVSRFFLWLLVEFISRRMDQLNFPISSLEVAKGMSSRILQLFDPQTNAVRYTGWLRSLKSSGHVIYAGLYSTIRIPGEENPCVKVTFPCRGSANVYLRPVQHVDGSFGLDSSASVYGSSGFYRIVASGPDHRRVRYIKTLDELFHVYVDAEGVLRTDHKISFLGFVVLKLHYKMTMLPQNVPVAEGTNTLASVSS
ncbi:MAG: hypothetical protein WBG02_04515 [Candidatus Acidiferrum sp.]